jgi:membrane protein YqaA with SNARE-associated domain
MQYVGPASALTKIVFAAIGLWFVTLICLFIFPHLLPVLSGFAGLLSLPVALVLLILALVALFVDKHKLWPALSFVLVPLVLYLVINHMMYWGALANYYLNRSYYETTTKRVLAAQNEDERKQICGEVCSMTSTNPPRVAFHYIDGFLSWHDIVHDPSGDFVKPMTREERFRISQYFIVAEHLTGDWYLVHFGD